MNKEMVPNQNMYCDEIAEYVIKAIKLFESSQHLDKITIYRQSDPATDCGPIISMDINSDRIVINYEKLRDSYDDAEALACYYAAQAVWLEFIQDLNIDQDKTMDDLCSRIIEYFPGTTCVWE